MPSRLEAKFFAGVLTGEHSWWERARGEMEGRFGPLDDEVLEFPFDSTDYYREEMGSGLLRIFCSFRDPVAQQELADFKRWTTGLESKLSGQGGVPHHRRVNLDPGLLTAEKVVLASTKNFSHRIYLRDGIFAEVSLVCREGTFQALEWTYPDYRRRDTLQFFNRLRIEWRSRLRRTRRVAGCDASMTKN